MNTIRSTWIGWGTLCVAGGAAYYLANKSFTADRATRQEEMMRHKAKMAMMEAEYRRAPTDISKESSASSPSSQYGTRQEPRMKDGASPVANG
ncbi:hypothetical protein BJX61DRAFT_546297 [Aspergillus egyptiacus]|nr:hypothetical protein BJX61DRAFT_546297 [Aspergillus egyptiacus]